MSDSPIFSIVLPVYNAVDYIDDCIRSITDQSYQNFELIIIDGGSTDGTVEIIKKYQNEISFFESKKDNGQSYAINKGFSRATGDIFCWLNADERYFPDSLLNVAQAWKKNLFEYCYGTTQLTVPDRSFSYIRKFPPIPPFWYILIYGDVTPSEATFWTKSLHKRCGMLNEKEYPRLSMDYDWFLRLTSIATKWHRIKTPLALRIERTNASTNAAGSKKIKTNRNKIITDFFKAKDSMKFLRYLFFFSPAITKRLDPWERRNWKMYYKLRDEFAKNS